MSFIEHSSCNLSESCFIYRSIYVIISPIARMHGSAKNTHEEWESQGKLTCKFRSYATINCKYITDVMCKTLHMFHIINSK